MELRRSGIGVGTSLSDRLTATTLGIVQGEIALAYFRARGRIGFLFEAPYKVTAPGS